MPTEVAETASRLLEQGVLGSVCVLLIVALVFIWRAKEKADAEHKIEIKALMERHIAKAEEWVEKSQLLATDLNRVLDTIAKGRQS